MSATPPSTWSAFAPARLSRLYGSDECSALSSVGMPFSDTPRDSSAWIEETKQVFRRYRPGGRKVSDAHLLEVWTRTTSMLQQCDLCINFSAFDFFSMPYQGDSLRTEQLSAALNYGSQPHGPRPSFGMSFFVLSEAMKRTALYFVRDALLTSHRTVVKDHVTFATLGSAYGIAAKHNEALRHALDEVCFHYETLPDNLTESAGLLSIEARLSRPVLREGDIKAVRLSPLAVPATSRVAPELPLTGEVWADVQRNAQKFAEQYGGTLLVADEERPANGA